MVIAVKVIDWEMGQAQVEKPELRLVSETLTAGELVAERIQTECASINAKLQRKDHQRKQDIQSWLVRPSSTESRLNGKERVYGPGMTEATLLDAEQCITAARKAFEAGQFIMLFDDTQAGSWDQRLIVKKGSAATFIKLHPLKGG